jgi:hypothetical protein
MSVSSNAPAYNSWYCSTCQRWVGGNHACAVNWGSFGITPPVLPTCEHCFCQEAVLAVKPHEQCCMCGTRRVKATL